LSSARHKTAKTLVLRIGQPDDDARVRRVRRLHPDTDAVSAGIARLLAFGGGTDPGAERDRHSDLAAAREQDLRACRSAEDAARWFRARGAVAAAVPHAGPRHSG